MVLELQILTWEGTKTWRDNVFICGIKFQKKEMYVLLEFRLNVHSAIILSCVINEITRIKKNMNDTCNHVV
jgi:hypothetical protein